MVSYKKLIIWQEARKLSIDIHEMSLALPAIERFETGKQIRRSSKSIRVNTVEGYGRRKYQADLIRFLIYAHASLDETRDHLVTLFETGSLKNETKFNELSKSINTLGSMIHNYIRSIEKRPKP